MGVLEEAWENYTREVADEEKTAYKCFFMGALVTWGEIAKGNTASVKQDLEAFAKQLDPKADLIKWQ